MTENQAVQAPVPAANPAPQPASSSQRAFGPRRFDNNSRGPRPGGAPGDRRGPGGPGGGSRDGRFSRNKMRARPDRRPKQDRDESLDSQVIVVRRVTRVTKGGKKMRFSALVVTGDRKGRVGYAIRKGVDYQAAVNKATKKAQQSLIKVDLTEDGTLKFPSQTKFKAAEIFIKPAKQGTGLIAGGYLRPVLELAGVQNIYSKIIGGRNKISGVQAAMKALIKYKAQ
jgi:small subunit ribosomal protein S5